MAHNPRYVVRFRRRREGKTDYHKRTRLLKSHQSRFVVRKSLRHMTVQIINAELVGDTTVVSAHSSELKRYGWEAVKGNLPEAYLVGYLAGLKAKKASLGKALLDTGTYAVVRGGRIFASVRGALDAGLAVPCDESVLPKEERMRGAHISEKIAGSFEVTKKKMEEAF